jgi:hypothetical protein
MTTQDLKVGDHVHYCPAHSKGENGIVKEIRENNTTGVWVVYNCAGNWDRYMDYTGALTNLQDLVKEWRY